MKYKINLLIEKQYNLVNKVFYFFLHYLRYILVVTLLIANGVFFYKISIDQEIIWFSESINQKEEIIKVSKPSIDKGQSINSKLEEIQSVIKKQNNLSQIMDYLLSRFPAGMSLTTFNTDGVSIKFNGKTQDPALLQTFYRRLLVEKRFQGVQLNNINKKLGDVYFTFSLNNFIR